MIAVFGVLVAASLAVVGADPEPGGPLIVDDGLYTSDPTRLSASWSIPPSTLESHFVEYRYAIGTTPHNPGSLSELYPVLLTIGNSITYSGPVPQYGWLGMWGMEASSLENDYVHRIISKLKGESPLNAVAVYSSTTALQAGGRINDVLSKIETFRGYHANLITIQMGENDSALTAAQYAAKLAEVLDRLLDNTPRPIIFCFGPWSSRSTYDANTREAQFDQAVAAVCQARQVLFRSVKPVALNPVNNNPGHALVQWHPNDRGHEGFADLFWDAMGGYVSGWQNSGSSSATVQNLWLVDGLTYYWYVQGKDSTGQWTEVHVSDGVIADSTPPDPPKVGDGGAYTRSTTSLTADWSAVDPTSPVVEYQYAIGTSPTVPASGYVVGWKSAGSATSVDEVISSLTPGTCYYFYVKARNAAGLWSAAGVSDGIYVLECDPISAGRAKLLPDGTVCLISDVYLTSSYEVLGTAYIEDIDRASAIGAKFRMSAFEGDILEAAGVVSTEANGERVLANATFRVLRRDPALGPLHARLRYVRSQDWHYDPDTGAGQGGVNEPGAYNLSTVGRLLKVVGSIVSIDGAYLHISDGSEVAGSPLRIEKIRLPSSLKVGDYIMVTGVSSCALIAGNTRCIIRPRRSQDCQIVLSGL